MREVLLTSDRFSMVYGAKLDIWHYGASLIFVSDGLLSVINTYRARQRQIFGK